MNLKLKKRILIVFAILGFNVLSYGQVGVGTLNPDNSAQLDITSKNRGLLVPRLALSETTSQSPVVGTIANSLLVYNTATTNDVGPGFYYWQDNKWVRIVAQSDPVIFNETLTTLAYNATSNELTYKDEKGNSNVLELVGQTGSQGIPGSDGSVGPQGPRGEQGLAGNNGTDGTDGSDGSVGPQGPRGEQGLAGNNGTNGSDGSVGPR